VGGRPAAEVADPEDADAEDADAEDADAGDAAEVTTKAHDATDGCPRRGVVGSRLPRL